MQDIWKSFVITMIYAGTIAAFIVVGYVLTAITKDEGWLFLTGVICAVFHYSYNNLIKLTKIANTSHTIEDKNHFYNRPEKEEVINVMPNVKAQASEELNGD